MYKHGKHLNDFGIARYVEGLLLPERFDNIPEEIRFHVMHCSECRKRVFVQFDIDRNDPEYIDQLRSIGRENEAGKKTEIRLSSSDKFIRLSPRFFLLAASFLVLVTGAVFIFERMGADHQDLYNQHFTAYPDILTKKSGYIGVEMLQTALFYYNTEKYDVAALAFQEYLSANPDDLTASFYLAICYLAENNDEQAKKILVQLSERFQGTTMKTPADWYLALAHLKSGNIDEARAKFVILSSEKGTYGKRAKEILKKL